MSYSPVNTKACALALAISGAIASTQAYAETSATEEKASLVETMIVVGRTTNTEITPEQLDKQQANDLADVFRHIPSVNVGGSLGFAQKVYIRGMEDTLLNITVDGAPQTGTLFHHVGRVSIEPELLQKVEVQAGAGEATSGAGAVGGSIRFKTKYADDFLEDGKNFGGFVKGNKFSNNGTKASVAAYGKISDRVGLLASHVSIDRENMEDGDGNELYGTAVEQNLTFVKADAEITQNQNLMVSYERRQESGMLGARPNWPTLEDDPLYPLAGERNTIVANYTADIDDVVNVNFTVYNTDSDLEQNGRWGLYGGNTSSTGFDLRNTSRFGSHRLTYGVDLRNDKVKAGPRGDSVQDYIEAGWETKLTETGQVKGVYIQDHWQVNAPLLLSFGVRYDSYNLKQDNYDTEVSSSGFSPNVGVSYSFTDELKFIAGHAKAMRGKEIGDSFTLDSADIEPGLKPEKVDNTEVGLEFNGDMIAVSATVYQSTINDVIFDQIGQGTYHENIGKLKSNGFELISGVDLGSLYLAASFSLSDSDINGHTVEGYEHNGLGNSRGDTYTLEASYSFTSDLEAGWNFTFVNGLNDIEVLQRGVELGWVDQTYTVDKPSYSVHDAYVRWQASDHITLNFAVQNLFNEHYRDHSSVADYNHIPDWEGVAGLYEAGRDVRLSASVKF